MKDFLKENTGSILYALFVLFIVILLIYSAFQTIFKEVNKIDRVDSLNELVSEGNYEDALNLVTDEDGKLKDYLNACILFKQGDYSKAINAFNVLGTYRDSKDASSYCRLCSVLSDESFDDARQLINDYKQNSTSGNFVNLWLSVKEYGLSVLDAEDALKDGKPSEALNIFKSVPGDFVLGSIAVSNLVSSLESYSYLFDICGEYTASVTRISAIWKALDTGKQNVSLSEDYEHDCVGIVYLSFNENNEVSINFKFDKVMFGERYVELGKKSGKYYVSESGFKIGSKSYTVSSNNMETNFSISNEFTQDYVMDAGSQQHGSEVNTDYLIKNGNTITYSWTCSQQFENNDIYKTSKVTFTKV